MPCEVGIAPIGGFMVGSGGNLFGPVLGQLPSGVFLLTGEFERMRAGAIVAWAMACSREPACVCVALPKGMRVSPIVRDSRAFGLCLIEPCAKLLVKKFGPCGEANLAPPRPKHECDPFDSIDVMTLVTGAPILTKCLAALDCEVIRHFDFEGDHELFVGRVAGMRSQTCDGAHAPTA